MKKSLVFLVLCLTFLYSNAQKLELLVQSGHTGVVYSVCFSPDGKYILTAGQDNKAKLWDFASRTEIKVYNGHSKSVNSACFTSDGKYILTCSDDNTAILFNTVTGDIIQRYLGHTGYIMDAAISPDGKFVVTGSQDKTAKLWDLATGKELKTFPGLRFDVLKVCFSPDSKTVLTSHMLDGVAILWDVETGAKIREFVMEPNMGVQVSAISPDGKYVAIGYASWVATYDISTGERILNIQANQELKQVSGIAYTKDGSYFATCSYDKTIVLWDAKTGDKIRTYNRHWTQVRSIAFSPDNKYMVSGGGYMDDREQERIRIWDVEQGYQVGALTGKVNEWIWAADISGDDRYLLTGGESQVAKLWDLSLGKIIQSYSGHREQINAVAISPDCKMIATAGGAHYSNGHDFTMRVWDFESGKMINSFDHDYYVSDVKFSADNKFLVSGSIDCRPKLYNRTTNTIDRVFYINSEPINSVAFSPDSKSVLFGLGSLGNNRDNSAQIWDITKNFYSLCTFGHNRADYNIITPVEFVKYSNNGKLYVSQGGGTVIVRDAITGVAKDSLNKLDQGIHLTTPFFMSDDKTLLTGSEEGSVFKWDVNTGAELSRFTADPYIQAIDKKGKFMVTRGEGALVKLWDIQTGQLVATFMSVGKDDWAIVTPQGYYMASKGATNYVRFVNGLNSYTFDNLDLILNRPDIVIKNLGVADASLVNTYKQAYLKRLKRMKLKESDISLEMHLPKIQFAENNFPMETDQNNITLKIEVSDDLYPLDRINVFINDVPIYGINGISLANQNGLQINKEITVKLADGKNKIQISALNKKGAESLREGFEIEYKTPSVKHNLYIVAIGISEYVNKAMNLTYAAKDANDLLTLMQTKNDLYNEVKAFPILNRDAVKATILNVKQELLKSDINDEVILFIAGHGLLDKNLDWYLGTHDVDFNNPAAKGVVYEDLEGLLDSIPALKKILIMDACNSGEVDKEESQLVTAVTDTTNSFVKSRGFKTIQSTSTNKSQGIGLKNSFELMQSMFANIQKGSGAIVISSASGSEFAFESSEWQNGVFTYSLLEGIKSMNADANKDYTITVSELNDYVSKRVKELTQGKQNPTSRKENLLFDYRVW